MECNKVLYCGFLPLSFIPHPSAVHITVPGDARILTASTEAQKPAEA
jgi:hypothetical protein